MQKQLTKAFVEGMIKDIEKICCKDPVRRGNTGDNTPAVLYTEIVPGEQIKITIRPKRVRK